MDRGRRDRWREKDRGFRGGRGARGIAHDETKLETGAEPVVRPVILAKPNRVQDNPEEWPSIDSAAASPREGSSPDTSRRTIPLPRSSAPTLATVPSKVNPPQSAKRKDPKIGEDIWDKQMVGGVQLITEGMDWADEITQWLSQDLSHFQVIGAIGPQSSGKSTLLSMIGGNDPFDMYRQYIFRPAAREAAEGVKHQTMGVQIYVTKSRIILLDCQPLLSSAVLDEMTRYKGRYQYDLRGCKTTDQLHHVESLQLVSFMMLVCHTLLLVTDWFIDYNMIRFIRTADMLRPDPPAAEGATHIHQRAPNLVVVQQRCQLEDFNLQLLNKRATLLHKLLAGTKLNFTNNISMSEFGRMYPQFGHPSFADVSHINYILLPDMKLKGQKDEDSAYQPMVPDYEVLIERFRILVRAMPRPSFTDQDLTEKSWYQYAMKAWDLINKSGLIADYRKLL